MPAPPPSTTPAANPPAPYVRPRRPISKTLLHWTRALHTYVTMFALILLIFFSFTGFVLNNEGEGKLFDFTKKSSDRTATIPLSLFDGKNELFNIEHYLREHLGARGDLPGNIDGEAQVIQFQFSSPGREANYSVIRTDGQVMINEQSNFLARLGDLHKGDHAGKVWAWCIDATAVFLCFASISGLILWISLPKRRMLGIIALAVSIAACLGVYFWIVP